MCACVRVRACARVCALNLDAAHGQAFVLVAVEVYHDGDAVVAFLTHNTGLGLGFGLGFGFVLGFRVRVMDVDGT